MNGLFSKDEVQMANKCVKEKKNLTSLKIKEMQMKTTMIPYHPIH